MKLHESTLNRLRVIRRERMLNKSTIENTIYAALSTGADFAEVFVEDKKTNTLGMLGGKLERALSHRDFGVGIRILKGTFSVYAFTNDVSEDNLIKVAKSAAKALLGSRRNQSIDLRRKEIDNQHPIEIKSDGSQNIRSIGFMRRAHEEAKNYDASIIKQTAISMMSSNQNILIANSDGLLVEDNRFYTQLGVSAIAEFENQSQSGFQSPSAYAGLEFLENLDIEKYARDAARIAKTMVSAEHAPSGKLPVVIANGFGGIVFHEACGHGLESTAVAPGASVFAGKIGEQVASPLVTAMDDGTIPNAWGSLNIDDEGAPTQQNLLIEDGILKGYLIDKLGARKMGMSSTGSGRRQSYQFAPASRMNNTFICNGKSTPEEIIKDTEYGILAKTLGGGSVNPATSEFNFSVEEAYMIRNGKIAEPVKGATLIGKGSETLKNIDRVGNDLELGPGLCGSISGNIPVTCGQPTIRVSEMTIGGRKGI